MNEAIVCKLSSTSHVINSLVLLGSSRIVGYRRTVGQPVVPHVNQKPKGSRKAVKTFSEENPLKWRKNCPVRGKSNRLNKNGIMKNLWKWYILYFRRTNVCLKRLHSVSVLH